MCWYGTAESYTEKVGATEVSYRNDKCRARQGQWQTNGILKADEKSKILPIILQLLCQIYRTIITGNARPSRWERKKLFHREDICPRRQVEGREIWDISGGLQTGKEKSLPPMTNSRRI